MVTVLTFIPQVIVVTQISMVANNISILNTTSNCFNNMLGYYYCIIGSQKWLVNNHYSPYTIIQRYTYIALYK